MGCVSVGVKGCGSVGVKSFGSVGVKGCGLGRVVGNCSVRRVL